MHLFRRRILILLLSLLYPLSLFGQTCPTYTASVSLNTGVNPTTGALLTPLGSPDPGWTVIGDPFTSTVEPRPADVFTNALSAWGTLPGSQWIGSQTDANQGQNGAYYYQRCFCLRDGFGNASLQLQMRADDQADVFLNATLPQIQNNSVTPILHGGNGHFWSSVQPDILTSPVTGLKFGTNCLIVRVQNISSGATGLDIAASITASGPGGTDGVLVPACCERTGALCGIKWNDLNHDGIHQSTELGLPNWTIQLSNGQTALTDQFGNYCFSKLPPGPYTITEQAQAGWVQMLPKTPPSYSLAVGAATATGGLDFGNWKGEEGHLKVCKVAGIGVPVGTPISFTAGSSPFTVLAGPAPGGTCVVSPGFFPVGSSVTVTEVIPAGDTVSDITVAPSGRLVGTPNLAGGTVNVTIGSGVTEVTYTDKKSGFLEICKNGHVKGSFTFTVNPGHLGPFVVPAGGCSPAIEVPAGQVTITEAPSSGTSMTGCSTIPASQQGPCNPGALTSTVTVAPGDVSTQTIAFITNKLKIPVIDPGTFNPN
jgi:hypothetical protein